MNRLNPSLLSSALLLALVTLAGCGGTIFESKKIDYKTAGKLPSLEVPPDLTTPGRDERYVVPENSKGTATFSTYADERAQSRSGAVAEVLPDAGKMRIERAGTQRWLVVPGTPDKLWPGIKDFWQETGFTIALYLPEAGVMETDWVENRAKIPQDFIRKAIGWVLRDTSKKRPDMVWAWVEPRRDDMSGVTRREALKYLGGRGTGLR